MHYVRYHSLPVKKSCSETRINLTFGTIVNLKKQPPIMTTPKRLGSVFFNRSCEQVARELLGQVLCRRGASGTVMRGRIVETEMYPGTTDKASHSFNNKKTRRNGAMFMVPGTSYVYIIYGMYHCFNISTEGDDYKQRHFFTDHSHCNLLYLGRPPPPQE